MGWDVSEGMSVWRGEDGSGFEQMRESEIEFHKNVSGYTWKSVNHDKWYMSIPLLGSTPIAVVSWNEPLETITFFPLCFHDMLGN